MKPGQTPVAFFVFRRPMHTRASFAAIRAYRPARLFLVADGPRKDHPEDEQRCLDVRSIVSDVDWPCEVLTNFASDNLGCSWRIPSGLAWVFSHADRAIVIEDDCVASPEFFEFCEQLLRYYETEESVWAVNGNSYQPEVRRGDGSYYFSKYPDCSGWATWRRAWRHYQRDLPFLKEWKRSRSWKACFPTVLERRHFSRVFDDVLKGSMDSWAYRWLACAIYGGGLSATPNANLVRNIGFDAEGTHTTTPGILHRHCPELLGPLSHPANIAADRDADHYLRAVVEGGGWAGLLRWMVRGGARRVVRAIRPQSRSANTS